MSRHRHRNLDRGIKQSLIDSMAPARRERHGKPVTVRRRTVVTNPLTGLVEVQYTNVPASEPRTVRVAGGPTGKHGKPNTPPTKGKVYVPAIKGAR